MNVEKLHSVRVCVCCPATTEQENNHKKLYWKAAQPWFYVDLRRIGLSRYSRCHVTTTMGPLRRRAESTTERKTDTQTFYHVSEHLYAAINNINVTFRLALLLITKS